MPKDFDELEVLRLAAERPLLERDAVNHPPHYTQGKIEVIEFIEDQSLSFALGNVVKYVARAKHKGDMRSDLLKARWYLDREIGLLEHD